MSNKASRHGQEYIFFGSKYDKYHINGKVCGVRLKPLDQGRALEVRGYIGHFSATKIGYVLSRQMTIAKMPLCL